jgi:thioredoxin-like negative regulator of GroEL
MRRLIFVWAFVFFGFSADAVADELLIFSLPGCPPCARLAATLKSHPELVADYKVTRIDMADDPESARLFNVRSAPTIVRIDDLDKEVGRIVGAPSKERLAAWLSSARNMSRTVFRRRRFAR